MAGIVSITDLPSTMEERMREAAREGNIEALYELIQEKADVLKEIDQMEYVDNPLHIAAAAGLTEFAMELMHLKPSFATKLNQEGLSPLHLALRNRNSKTVLSLLTFNKNLVRVKGKNGYTPFHYAVIKRDKVVLAKFITDCPECIHDATNRNETCLHLAAEHNNFEALRVLLPVLVWSSDRNMSEINDTLNLKNGDGNTVLHIAADKNQVKMVSLLTKYWSLNLKETNSSNLTALDILQSRNEKEAKQCANKLRRAQAWSFFWSPTWSLLQLVSQSAYQVRTMSGDKSNALLVVTVLILTATYQAALSPPGGVFQDNALPKNTTDPTSLQIHSGSQNTSTSNWHHLFIKTPSTAGSSVLSTSHFLWFFIPNIAAFCVSFVITCFVLISNLTYLFSSALVLCLFMLLFCLLVSAVLIISPNSGCLDIMLRYVYILVYILVSVMTLITVSNLIGKLRLIYKRHNLTNGTTD